MSEDKYILVGYSGHAYVVADAAILSNLNLAGYADTRPAVKNPFKLKYIGFEGDENFEGWEKNVGFIPGVGDNRIREKLSERILGKNETLITLIHPNAHVSTYCTIDAGTFVSSGANVNAFATIGKGVILNTGSIIEHECVLGDYSHIAPGAVLAGNVRVGKRSFIGANVVVKEGLFIGDDVIVGAGAVILKDIPDGKKVVGNPGRII